jgi:Flp pilus assembly protein TadG
MNAAAPCRHGRLARLVERFLRDERGISSIEFAVVSIWVIFLVVGTIELAVDMIVDASVQVAAQQASRVGLTTVNPSSGTRADQASAIVMTYLKGWKKIGATVDITTTNYSTYGNVGTSNSQAGMGGFGDVVAYNITVKMRGITGLPAIFGVSQLTFQRNYIVQNEK